MTALAMVLALAGAACYAVGAALQHQQAAKTTAHGLHPRLLARLARRPRWLAGIVANLAGAGLHVLALSLAPLALIQPIGVMTVAFAVPAGALLRRRRPQAGELVAAGAVSAGLALLMSTLRAPTEVPALQFLDVVPLAGAVVAVLGIASLVVRRIDGPVRTIVLATGAGLAFGVTSAMLRPIMFTFTASGLSFTLAWFVLAALAVAGIGMLLQQSSFQTGRLGLAIAVITVMDPLAAIGVGAGLLHQPVHVGSVAATVSAVVLVMGGVALLCRRFRRPYPTATDAAAALRPSSSGLRVLIGADTYPPHVNGAAYFSHRLAHGLAARGHEVHVCCPSADGDAGVERDGPVYVHRVRSMRTPFHRSFHVGSPAHVRTDVGRVLAEVRPDVVHVQNHFLVGRALASLSGRRGLPLVATNHFMPENLLPYLPLPGPLARLVTRVAWLDLARVFGPAHAVTTPTPTAARLVRASGIGMEVEAVSCGIDLGRFHESDTSGAGTDTKRILFVGRLDVEKHIDDIIDALPAVRRSVEAELVVAGIGNLREPLERRARELGVAEHVTFLGFVPDEDLPALYSSADVFCMPGTAELQSLVTLEAMATGRPVVAADAMALPHLCQDGRNGFLHTPRDSAGLAERVATILADDALRARMGKESLVIAAEHDESSSLRRFEEIYARVTGFELPAQRSVREPVAA